MFHDIRHAARAFARMPGFTLTAVVTLALGIGANTAIFSVVYALLLKPLPFRDPDQLIYLHDTSPAVQSASVSWPKFVALRDGNRTLASLAAVRSPAALTITGGAEPQQIAVARVSGDFFKVFSVAPLAGRWIKREDDVPNGQPVIVLGHGFWQRVFGGERTIVGQQVIADGIARTVIAIMPPDFGYPARVDAWVPLAVGPEASPGNNFLRLVGRMQPGMSVRRATEDLKAANASFNQRNSLQRDVRVYLLHEFVSAGNRQMLLVLQGAVLLVLLVACANVANMLLSRSVARRRELSVRTAIGASPGRLVRQLLTESVMLSAAGAGVGVLLASWLLRLFLALAPTGFAGLQAIAIDRHVLSFTVVVAVLTGIVFGLVPARRAFRVDANDGLRDAGARGASSGGGRGASRALVVAEIGLAIVLVVGAALMVKSLLLLQSQDAGFNPEGLLTFQISLPAPQYDAAAARRTMGRLLQDVRSIRGVVAAGAINYLPLVQFGYNGGFSIPGRQPIAPADRAPAVEFRMVTPDYFAAMGIPLRRGNDFTARENETGRPVVIINETMARQYWPNENPIGARLHIDIDDDAFVREIVGVVGDVRSLALNRPPVPETFVPYDQVSAGGMTIAVRTNGEPTALLPVLRQRLAAVNPDLPLVRPQTMNAVMETSAGSMRLSSVLTSMFAVVAALLATVGIYGLVAYSVAQRTREIGIRVALGADPATVLRMIVGEGLVLAAGGLVVGLVGAWALMGTLRTMLFEVSPADPGVLAGTCAAVMVVTAAASMIPARRVMRVDPTIALRADRSGRLTSRFEWIRWLRISGTRCDRLVVTPGSRRWRLSRSAWASAPTWRSSAS